MPIRGFFFDQDGVIIDTERDGHRVAFNRAFHDLGFDVQWDPETYYRLLEIPGGKERLRHYVQTRGLGTAIAPGDEQQLVEQLHERKTDIFLAMLEDGSLPLRPGVRRFMKEVNTLGLALGVCTTSSERTARAITEKILPDIHFDVVLAGDVVARKKPDPEI
jgi:beta-phosphoglucomutase-like phosphatase (HAD superfamily)